MLQAKSVSITFNSCSIFIVEMTDDIKRKEKHEIKTDDYGNVTEEKTEIKEEED
jgi:hypothetical protein